MIGPIVHTKKDHFPERVQPTPWQKGTTQKEKARVWAGGAFISILIQAAHPYSKRITTLDGSLSAQALPPWLLGHHRLSKRPADV